MRIKAVFFDLGETLIDETRMWREWAAFMGIPLQTFMAILEAVIAEGEHHHLAFERLGCDPKAAQRQRIAEGTHYLFSPDDLYPDAKGSLRSLQQAGYFIGIAGNQSRGLLPSMRALGLEADLITTSGHLGFDKPSPQFYEALLRQAGFRPDEAAYVGDRVDNDILPAKVVGLVTVFIERGPWGRIHARQGKAAQADVRINALADIGDALGRFTAARQPPC